MRTKKNLIKSKEHFDHYEKNKIMMQKNINELEDEISKLNNENEEKLNTLKEEYKKSNLKDTELNVYLEEKKTMKQKLQDNNNKISKLKKSKSLLIKGLEKQKRINESKTKENNELKNEIKKLEKSRIELGGLPDKNKEWLKLEGIKIPEDFNIDKYFKGEKNKYLDINLIDVNNLVGKIKQDVNKIDNITDIGNNESVNFNDIINFSKDIMNGKINNSNKEKKYNEKFKNIEENLEN